MCFCWRGTAPGPSCRSPPRRPPGCPGPELAGVVVVNATRAPLDGWFVRARVESWDRPLGWRVPAIPALSARKVTVHLVPTVIATKPGPVTATVELARCRRGRRAGRRVDDAARRVRGGRASRRVFTFASGIDGSVQTYAVTPRARSGRRTPPTARWCCRCTARASRPRVRRRRTRRSRGPRSSARRTGGRSASTGRTGGGSTRWRCSSRRSRRSPHDPARRYLTGHSMGGHGTWHLGVHVSRTGSPPSARARAGCRFFSYGGAPAGPDDPVAGMLRRAAGTSDTLALATNLAPLRGLRRSTATPTTTCP